MKILVDTSVWFRALRRTGALTEDDRSLIGKLQELIDEGRVTMIGPIRQELLSGVARREQFEELKEKLAAFDDLPLNREDYERAAEFYNICRKTGVQGSQIDFLICAVAAGRGMPIFTTDNDFRLYEKYLEISLFRGE